jgi:hypothetical protein
MGGLIDEFLEPTEPPGLYTPADDVVEFKAFNDGRVVAEVFRRASGSLGYRYAVWVAWRDAGDMVRGHGWHRVPSRIDMVTDDPAVARAEVNCDLRAFAMNGAGDWIPAV